MAEGGSLSPGNGVGGLSVQGGVVLAGSLLVELLSGSSFDTLFASTLTLTPTSLLSVNALNGFSPVAGMTFDLIDWTSSLVGNFGDIQLPVLNGNLRWNTNQLYATGEIQVESDPIPTQVPIPAFTLWLMAGALITLANRACKVK